jgi:RNA polymerase sigma-70 factor (ECF subfamily)
VRPHLQALYRLAYRFTGRQHEAEDLLQELLTRLYTRPERLNGIESLRPWLARALYNLYIDEHRRLRRSPLGHLHSTAAGGATEEDALAVQPDKNTDLNFSTEIAQMRQHLVELVQQLPQEQRDVVILHDVEGYELQEAAEILGVAVGTVKSRLHRGHERLREWLRQRNLSPATVVLSTEGPAVEPESPVARVSSDEMY